VPWNDFVQTKRVLDIGAAGVMVPWVNNAEEARRAAAAMRYPPEGIRGLARMTRAGRFGFRTDDYTRVCNEELVTIVQIETAEAVRNAAEIAAVEGVDVLFVGPSDLSMDMGVTMPAEDPRFAEALQQVVAAARTAGKAAGILLHNAAQVESTVKNGFTFVALGSDGSMVAAGMRVAREAFRVK
jgi:2-keto-3-deoxy-L-rhamnonate aldolase RhmA